MPTFSCASEKDIPKYFNCEPIGHEKYSHKDLNKLSALVEALSVKKFSSDLQYFVRNLGFAEQLICGSIDSPPYRDFASWDTWVNQFEESYRELLSQVSVNAHAIYVNHTRVARKNTNDVKKISQLTHIDLELNKYHQLRIEPLLKAKKIVNHLSKFDSQQLDPAESKMQKAFFLLCRNDLVNELKMDDVRLSHIITGQWPHLWKIYKACIENSNGRVDAIDTIHLFIGRLLVEFANESDFFSFLSAIVKEHWCATKNSDCLLTEINKVFSFGQLANISLIEAVTQLHKVVLSSDYQSLLMRHYADGLRPEHFHIMNDVKLYSTVLSNWCEAREYVISLDALFQKLHQIPSSQWIRYTCMLMRGDLLLEFALAKNWSECLSLLTLSSNLKPHFLSLSGAGDVQPIHLFAKAGHLALVTLAIAQGASLIEQTADNKTPIQLAAENEHWDVVSKIAELHCADSTDSEHYGLALYLAAQAQKWDVCELLMRKNASLHFAPYDILRLFCESGQSALLQLCFHEERNKAYFISSMSIRDKDAVPIIAAAKNDHWETVLILSHHDRDDAPFCAVYQYLLKLAVSRTQLSFIKNLLMQYPDYLSYLSVSDQFVCTLALAKYQDATQLIIQHKESCFDSLNGDAVATDSHLTDFFKQQCDFRTVELDLALMSQLVAFGVPIDQFSNASKDKLLSTDDWFSLPVATLFRIVVAKIPADISKHSLPPSPMHHITTDCTIKINQLTNLNFIEFTRWLCLLKNYLKINQQMELVKKIMTMLNQCHDVLAGGIDHLYLNSLYGQLNAAPSPITLFPRENRPNLTAVLKAFYPDVRNLDLMAHLLKKNQGVFSILPLRDVRFQILLYFACFLSRANYPRHLFLPEVTAEIGVSLSRCEDHDPDDLIFVGASLQNAKIIVVSEFLQVFNQSHDFSDPVTREPMDEQMILALLRHPKIRAAVVAANEKEKSDVQVVAHYRPIITEVVNKLAELGQILYNASTDSGRQTFDEDTANRAIAEFRQYSENLPRLIVGALHAPSLSFYLNARGAMTNYSQLFSQMTFQGCSGQLGLTIRQWVSKFKDNEQTVLADMHFTKLSPYLDLMISMPMDALYATQVTSRDCRMSGKGLVKALLEQERLVEQLRH